MKMTSYFLAARNSSLSILIGLSFFASGMGAWVVYGTTVMGATPQLSWLGVLGYSMKLAFPTILITWLGPKVRSYINNHCHGKVFATTNFDCQRYGRIMQLVIGCVSLFYMFIYIVAELTSISNVFGLLTSNTTEAFSYSIAISLGAITIFYTSHLCWASCKYPNG